MSDRKLEVMESALCQRISALAKRAWLMSDRSATIDEEDSHAWAAMEPEFKEIEKEAAAIADLFDAAPACAGDEIDHLCSLAFVLEMVTCDTEVIARLYRRARHMRRARVAN